MTITVTCVMITEGNGVVCVAECHTRNDSDDAPGGRSRERTDTPDQHLSSAKVRQQWRDGKSLNESPRQLAAQSVTHLLNQPVTQSVTQSVAQSVASDLVVDQFVQFGPSGSDDLISRFH